MNLADFDCNNEAAEKIRSDMRNDSEKLSGDTLSIPFTGNALNNLSRTRIRKFGLGEIVQARGKT